MSQDAPRYSIVIPAFNEASNLRALSERLMPVMNSLAGNAWELVVVDDGSTDRTWDELKELAGQHPVVRGLRFSRNFGHHIAVTAGLDSARGERVVVMDADLQHRPEDITRLAQALDEGADMALARPEARAHALSKRVLSRLFVWLVNHYGDPEVEIDSSLFRAMTRPVVDAVIRCREHDRYIAGLMNWVGFRRVSVPVSYAPRHSGQAKYSLRKSLLLALSTVVSHSTVPLRLATLLGILFSSLSFLLALEIIVQRLLFHVTTSGYTSLFAGMMLLGGINLLMLGVIGEYLAHVVGEVKDRPLYVVRETVGPTA